MLEKEIQVCNQYLLKKPENKWRIQYSLGRISALDDILGTNSSSKINMGFATQD